MSDRLIFRLKHNGETLAYLYQNWGMGDGEEIERRVRRAAKTYNLDLTKRADAIQAVRIAGEEQYGHALWTANEGEKDAEWRLATADDRAYLDTHRDDIIADNQDECGIRFFYGTYEGYPAYIDEWCEDAYTMNV
jgi:hypothetical protein